MCAVTECSFTKLFHSTLAHKNEIAPTYLQYPKRVRFCFFPTQDMVYQDVEKTKKFLKENWLGAILEIFKTCQKKKQLPMESRLQVKINFFCPIQNKKKHFFA